ncbi:hypothetical protein HYT56_01525 [Candidatus Woesearchaeota archaeon]|nr:hypothetical protein [Candidatus Woesearchaeota archaeon]
MENSGDIDLVGIFVKAIGEKDADSKEVSMDLKILDKKKINIEIDARKTGDLKNVEVFPLLESGLCSSFSLSKNFEYDFPDELEDAPESPAQNCESQLDIDNILSVDSCSAEKPFYCSSERVLVENCQKCGCPNGLECTQDGTCKESICKIVNEKGSPEDKLDIVFIGDNFNKDYAKFGNDVNRFIAALLKYEPFASEQNKINFYKIENEDDLGCGFNCVSSTGEEGIFCCDLGKIEEVSSQCPNEQVMVIYNGDILCGSAYSGRGVVCNLETPTLGFSMKEKIFVHEFGHTFGRLMDESYNFYLGADENTYVRGPNCVRDSACPEWDGLGVGCFKGCTYNNLYRPSQSCTIMMGDYFCEEADFNPVGEKALIEKMAVYR